MAKLRENRRVHWLPGSATESTDGAPLCTKLRVARLVVEATLSSETEFDVSATQLEESEENTQTQNTKTLPRHVSMDEHDARRIAHLQSRSRSGEDSGPLRTDTRQARTGVKTGEGRIISSSSDATDPQHAKAVLYRLKSGEQHFQSCPEDGVEARLVECASKRSDQLTGLS